MLSRRQALCACPVVVAAAFAVALWNTPSAAKPPAQEAPPKTDTQPAAPEPVPHHAFGSLLGVRPAEGERIPTMKGGIGFEFPIQARVGVSPAGTAGGHSFALAFEVKYTLGKRVTCSAFRRDLRTACGRTRVPGSTRRCKAAHKPLTILEIRGVIRPGIPH
jgi:hypothetical protein